MAPFVLTGSEHRDQASSTAPAAPSSLLLPAPLPLLARLVPRGESSHASKRLPKHAGESKEETQRWAALPVSPFAWSVAWHCVSGAGHSRWEGKERLALTGSRHGYSRFMTAPAAKGLCSASGLQAEHGRWHFSEQLCCCREINFL